MKKIVFMAVIALFIFMPIFAQEAESGHEAVGSEKVNKTEGEKKEKELPVKLIINFSYFGIGIYMPFQLEGSIELLRIGFEHKKTGLGGGFRPFYMYGRIGTELYESTGLPVEGGVSIINAYVNWNIIPLVADDDNFFVAPFIDFNYLFMGKELDASKYMLSVGLSGGRLAGEKVKFFLLSVETGFRLIDGNPYFFAVIKGGR